MQLSAVAASCVVTLKRVGGETCSSHSEIWGGVKRNVLDGKIGDPMRTSQERGDPQVQMTYCSECR